VGLLTALEHYRLTTSWADGTWILVPRDQNPPREKGLHVVRVDRALLDAPLGIDQIEVHGARVKITSPTRTVLDCWKYTRRIPPSIAIEALNQLRASRFWDGRQIYHLARHLRVWARIRPFLESAA
jgi:hypothetical protein